MDRPRTRSRLPLAAAVALLVAGVVLGAGTAAWAHGGEARIEVVSATVVPGPTPTAQVTVRVTSSVDGHPADGAQVTAQPASGGTPVALVPTGSDGHFTGAVAVVSGAPARLQITSTFPPGTQLIDVQAAPSQVTTPGQSPSAGSTVPAGGSAATTPSLPTTTVPAGADQETNTGGLAAGGVAVVVVLVGAAFVTWRAYVARHRTPVG